MKNNETHTAENTLVDFFNKLVGYFVMSHMTPPDEHVSVFKNVVGESAAALCKRSCFYLNILLRGKKILYAAVNACRITSSLLRIAFNTVSCSKANSRWGVTVKGNVFESDVKQAKHWAYPGNSPARSRSMCS